MLPQWTILLLINTIKNGGKNGSKISLLKNIDLGDGSLTVGNSRIDNSGVGFKNTAGTGLDNGKPKLTETGIDAGNKVIPTSLMALMITTL